MRKKSVHNNKAYDFIKKYESNYLVQKHFIEYHTQFANIKWFMSFRQLQYNF